MNAHTATALIPSAADVASYSPEKMVPAATVAAEFDITRRTLARWAANKALGFPAPTIINGRWYFHRKPLEAWKIARVRGSIVEAV